MNAAIPESLTFTAHQSAAGYAVRKGDECPGCGLCGAQICLRAPDRFHGRQHLYTLARCRACQLVWTMNPPTPAEMHCHYTTAYDKLIAEAGNSPQRWAFRVTVLEQFKQSGSLLDLGCSSGSFLRFLNNSRWSLHGIEMSEDSAKEAEAKTGGRIFCGEVLDAAFAPASFDIITCFDVFEHLNEPGCVLHKVVEWLKPGGIFYIMVPNIDSAESRIFRSYWHGLELPRHLFHYSPSSLRYLAESAGLQTVSLKTHRNPAVGTSLRYLFDGLSRRIGICRTPVAYRKSPGFAWRAARKFVRITILRLILIMAPLAGGGESIHAVFQKCETATESPV